MFAVLQLQWLLQLLCEPTQGAGMKHPRDFQYPYLYLLLPTPGRASKLLGNKCKMRIPMIIAMNDGTIKFELVRIDCYNIIYHNTMYSSTKWHLNNITLLLLLCLRLY